MRALMLKKLFAPADSGLLFASGRWSFGFRFLLTFCAYLAVAELTTGLGSNDFRIPLPFTPANGVALAALLLGGSRLWPAVVLATLASAALTGTPLIDGLLVGLGHALGAWTSYRLLQGPLKFDMSLARPRDVLHLCFTAPAVGGLISSLSDVAALALSGPTAPSLLGGNWQSWWIGDIAGCQLVAPLLLAWLQPRESASARRKDPGAVVGLLALTGISLWFFTEHSPELFAYSGLLLLGTLIWLAFSFDLRVVTLALVAIALLAGFSAAAGEGLFAGLAPQEMQIRLEVLIATFTTLTLALAAANRQRRTAERDRSRMQVRLEEVLDSLDDVVWTMETDGPRFSYLSHAVTRMTGRPVEDFYADPRLWVQQVHPDDLEATKEASRRLLDGRPSDHENRVLDGQGRVRWIRTRSRPVQDENGKVVRVHGITQDITDLRLANSRLATSEERLRQALGASEVGIWELDINAGALSFVQAEPNDGHYGLGERSITLFEWEASLHPEDRTRVMQALTDCLDGRSNRFRCEYRLRTRQSHWRWFRGEGQVVEKNADGRASRLSGTFRDVHERKLAEEALEKLSMAVEQNPSVVFITDAEGHFEYCNQAFTEVTGYALEDVLGQTPGLLKSGLNNAATYADLWRTITAGNTWRGRLLNRRQDGSLYTCSQAISPVRDGNGQITHYVSVSQDLSELSSSKEHWRPWHSDELA